MDFLIGAVAAVAYSVVHSSSTTQNTSKKSSKSSKTQCGGGGVANASEGFYEINAIEYMALSAVENMHTIIASVKENKRMSIQLEQEAERHKLKNKRKLKMDARMVGKISQGLKSVQKRQRIQEYAKRMKERKAFIREQKQKRKQNGTLIQQTGGGLDWLNILQKTARTFEEKSNIQTKGKKEFTFVKHFLAYADSIHDFNDKRSLLKYKFKRELTPEMKKGFEVIKANVLIKKPTALLFSSDMETKLFNYVHNVAALTYDKSFHHLDDFKYYIGSSTKTKTDRVFKYSEAFVNSKEKRTITSGEIESMFRSHGLKHYNVDISISSGKVVDHKSFGLEQIISIMNIWDPAKSAPKTFQQYTDVTYISTDSDKSSDTFRDPRLFDDIFCIQDNKEGGINLDLYCDNHAVVNLKRQRTDPINKVILISIIIILIENLDDNIFVNLELKDSVVNETLNKIQKQGLRIKNKITANIFKSFQNLWSKNKRDIINSVEVICDKDSTVHSFVQQLQDEVKKGEKKQILTVLYEMKKTGDWGQASWVYETNKSRKKNEQIIFVSGDRLAALYSILIGNNTLFGAKNIAGIRGKVWGTYLPSLSSMKGKGEPEAVETKQKDSNNDKEIMKLIGTDRSLQEKHFCKNGTYKELLTSLFSIDYSAIYNELSGGKISLPNKNWYSALNKLTIESNISLEEFLVYDFMMFTVPTLYSYIVEFEEYHKCESFTPEGWIGIMQAKLNVPNDRQFSNNEDKLLQIGIINDWIFTHEEETGFEV